MKIVLIYFIFQVATLNHVAGQNIVEVRKAFQNQIVSKVSISGKLEHPVLDGKR